MRRRTEQSARTAPPRKKQRSFLSKLASLFRSGSSRRDANGAGSVTPNHAARVPYLDEFSEPEQVPMTGSSELAAFLVVTSGDEANKRFGLRPISRLGRDLRFDIRPHDAEISRQHAVITFDGTGFSIRDLNSANGTFVNDKRIELERELRHGDVVRIGNTSMRFDYQPKR
jgi:pSer/pThr/pTyr-binding forkhead associated (FHA) protein